MSRNINVKTMPSDPGSHCSPPELDLLKSPGGGRNEKSALGPALGYFIHRRTLVLLVSNFLTTTSPGVAMLAQDS